MKTELIYREILYNVIELRKRTLTQRELARVCHVSVGLVNFSLAPLRRMGAIVVNERNFVVQDPWKILMYWCSKRELQRYVVYCNFLRHSVQQIESSLPKGSIPTAYTGYKELFDEVPADYSEVYVYGKTDDFIKIFGKENKNQPNLIVLQIDERLQSIGRPTIAQIYADLWNIGTWYAKRFIDALNLKLKDALGGG